MEVHHQLRLPSVSQFWQELQRNARDEYVYIYSPDTENAYVSADRIVLARVRKDQLKDHATYKFFAGELEAQYQRALNQDLRPLLDATERRGRELGLLAQQETAKGGMDEAQRAVTAAKTAG